MIDTIAERPIPFRQIPPEAIPGHINTACLCSGAWTTYVHLPPANPANTVCPCIAFDKFDDCSDCIEAEGL